MTFPSPASTARSDAVPAAPGVVMWRRGEKYYVYYIDITLPDSTRKEIQVPVGSYVKMRSGATVKVTIEQGALGMKVIKELGVTSVRS